MREMGETRTIGAGSTGRWLDVVGVGWMSVKISGRSDLGTQRFFWYGGRGHLARESAVYPSNRPPRSLAPWIVHVVPASPSLSELTTPIALLTCSIHRLRPTSTMATTKQSAKASGKKRAYEPLYVSATFF